jgi:hypothetical protein
MVLVHTTDTAPAVWLANSPTPPQQLITFGPAGYEAYARLRYIPDPTSSYQPETDAYILDDHPLWGSQARRALTVLGDFTDTADECYFCVWEGVGGNVLSPLERQGPLLTLPHRRYVLFTGRLSDYTETDAGRFNDSDPVPAFVWPADRRWCFTSDVDPHWAGIGAEEAAVERLLSTKSLDIVRAIPNERPPAYR